MIKQKNILSGIAIFIALYMTAALGWWTYSLLKYNRAESELQLRSLQIQKELCIEKFINKFGKFIWKNIWKHNKRCFIEKHKQRK